MITRKDITKYLEEQIKKEKISSWIIKKETDKKQNLYFERNFKKESELYSKRCEFHITIFRAKGKLQAEAQFSISESDTFNDFEKTYKKAQQICNYSDSSFFPIPKKDDIYVKEDYLNPKDFYCEEFEEDFKKEQILQVFAKKITNLKKHLIPKENIEFELNALELHTKFKVTHLTTSTYIDKKMKKTYTYFECVITAKNMKSKREAEHIVYEKINDIYNFNFDNFFKEMIRKAEDKLRSEQAKNFKGKVMLNRTCVKDFFTPDLTLNSCVGHSSSKLKFQKISSYEIGKKVIKAQLEPITIHSNSLYKKNASSQMFDDFGVSAQKTLLIEKGVVKNFFASTKYAHYLNIKPTGPLGVIEVSCGRKTCNELESYDKYCIIEAFSSFVPDITSGDFSAEIRLGYIVENGVKTPFTEGLFTGNIFALLEQVEFSKEKQESVGFVGPKKVVFHKGEIVGE